MALAPDVSITQCRRFVLSVVVASAFCTREALPYEITAAQLDEAWPFDLRTAFRYEVPSSPDVFLLSSVKWTGKTFDSPSVDAPMHFLLRVYGDSNTQPAETWCERDVEPEQRAMSDGCHEYVVSIDPPISLPASSSVWIEIQAIQEGLPQWGIAAILEPAVDEGRCVRGAVLGFPSWTWLGVQADRMDTAASVNRKHRTSGSTPLTKASCELVRIGLGRSFNLKLGLPNHGRVEVVLFDTSGRSVTSPTTKYLPKGRHEVSFEIPNRVPRGCYFVQVRHDQHGTLGTAKIILLR